MYLFPPKGLEKAVFQRARSDGVRAIFIVPTAVTAGYWKGLRARSTALLELTSGRAEFDNPQGIMGNHTVFLVDFGETDSRLASCCGQAGCHHGRRQRLSQVELEERSRTKAELARLDGEAQPCSQGSASH